MDPANIHANPTRDAAVQRIGLAFQSVEGNDKAIDIVIKQIGTENIDKAQVVYNADGSLVEPKLAIVPVKKDEIDAELADFVLIEDSDVEGSAIPRTSIIGLGSMAGMATLTGGLGTTVVETGMGMVAYTMATPTTASMFYQAAMGSSIAPSLAGLAVGGVSVPLVLNAFAAIGAATGTVKLGQAFYNRFIATRPEEQVDITMREVVQSFAAQIPAAQNPFK